MLYRILSSHRHQITVPKLAVPASRSGAVNTGLIHSDGTGGPITQDPISAVTPVTTVSTSARTGRVPALLEKERGRLQAVGLANREEPYANAENSPERRVGAQIADLLNQGVDDNEQLAELGRLGPAWSYSAPSKTK